MNAANQAAARRVARVPRGMKRGLGLRADDAVGHQALRGLEVLHRLRRLRSDDAVHAPLIEAELRELRLERRDGLAVSAVALRRRGRERAQR